MGSQVQLGDKQGKRFDWCLESANCPIDMFHRNAQSVVAQNIHTKGDQSEENGEDQRYWERGGLLVKERNTQEFQVFSFSYALPEIR